MPAIRRHGVLHTGANHFPESRPSDPRRSIELRAAEDTELYVRVLDDGGSPVPFADGMTMSLTVRTRPLVDEEKVLRIAGVPQPLEGPEVWLFTFDATTTRRKSPEFTRGFYDVVLTRPGGQRDFVIPASPLRLLGAPGAP